MTPPPPPRRWLWGRSPRRTLVRLAVVAGLSLVVFGWLLKPVRLSGPSMLPTLAAGRLTFVWTLAYRWTPPARGDIVAVRLAGPSVLYVKRIVGLPGERVRIDAGQLSINGRPLSEPYVRSRARWQLPEVTLEGDEYFLIGDNRGMPMRDHALGRVRVSRILGKVVP